MCNYIVNDQSGREVTCPLFHPVSRYLALYCQARQGLVLVLPNPVGRCRIAHISHCHCRKEPSEGTCDSVSLRWRVLKPVRSLDLRTAVCTYLLITRDKIEPRQTPLFSLLKHTAFNFVTSTPTSGLPWSPLGEFPFCPWSMRSRIPSFLFLPYAICPVPQPSGFSPLHERTSSPNIRSPNAGGLVAD